MKGVISMLSVSHTADPELTDVSRFTGRAIRILTPEGECAVAIAVRATSAAGLSDEEFFARLHVLIESLSPDIAWSVADCDGRLAADLAKWCERREIFYHYCERQKSFALARR
jgi:hypothetical protein